MYAKSEQELLKKHNDVVSYRKYKERRIDTDTFVLRFFRMVYRLTSNEYNAIQALTITENCFDGIHKIVIQTLLAEIRHGTSFSEALTQFDEIFSNTIVEILHVSEMTGRLAIATGNIVEYLEHQMQFNTKVKNTMRYPIFVLVLILIVSIIWIVWIIPQFNKIFEELELSVPTVTKCLLNLSNFVKDHYIITFSTLVAICLAQRCLNIKIPVVSTFKNKINKLQFFEAMTVMLRENVHLLDAIKCVTNRPEFRKYSKLIDLITNGNSFATASKHLGLFNPQEVVIISVSEQTGQYWVAFKTFTDVMKLSIEDDMNKLTKRIPSILICIVGGMLVLFVYGTFFPLYSTIDVVVESSVY